MMTRGKVTLPDSANMAVAIGESPGSPPGRVTAGPPCSGAGRGLIGLRGLSALLVLLCPEGGAAISAFRNHGKGMATAV